MVFTVVTAVMYIICSGLFHLLNHFLNFEVLGSLGVQRSSTLLPSAAARTPNACTHWQGTHKLGRDCFLLPQLGASCSSWQLCAQSH